jgi:hypothetical protein
MISNFWSKVTESGDCLEWNGVIDRHGYGRYNKQLAHRFAYQYITEDLDNNLQIDHLCRNRRCVNPEHMEQVTSKENTLRGTGITANFAKTTHCPQGHIYDEANTYYTPSGSRTCRACNRYSVKRYKERIKQS